MSAGPDPSRPGKYLRVSRTFHGPAARAERFLAKLAIEVAEGRVTAPSRRTLGELVEAWIAHIELPPDEGEGPRQGLAPKTVAEYRRIARQRLIPALGGIALDDLTAKHFDDYYRELRVAGRVGRVLKDGSPAPSMATRRKGLSVASARRVRTVATAALRQGVVWGWLAANVSREASPGREHARKVDREKVPTVEEAGLYFAEAAASRRPEREAFLRVLAATGGRPGEACALRWSGLALDSRLMTIEESVYELSGTAHGTPRVAIVGVKDTKAHQGRTIRLDHRTAQLLRDHRAAMEGRATAFGVELGPDAFVFSGEPGGSLPWRPSAAGQFFTRLRDRVGKRLDRPLRTTLYDFRHFHLTELKRRGVPKRMIAERAGHADTAMLDRFYDHGRDADDDLAADVIGEALYGEPPAEGQAG